MATSYFRAGFMERAIDHFRTAWAFYRTTTDDAPFVLVVSRFLAAALYNEGRTRESTAFLREAVETVVRCGDPRTSDRARLTFASYLADSGELAETRVVLGGIDPALLGDVGSTALFWQTTCRVCALQGDLEGVRRAAAATCAMDDYGDEAPAMIEALAECGISALIAGETAAARRCLTRALDTCVARGLTAAHGDLLMENALERRLGGALEEARTLALRGLPLIGEGKLGRHRAVLAALAVGTALDDRELLGYEPDAALMDLVFETALPLIYGPLAALCAQLQAGRGERDDARRLLLRAVRSAMAALPMLGSFPLAIVAAQHGERADAGDVRELCTRSLQSGPAAKATADLAEAILVRRFGDPLSAPARRAAAGFGSIGWPVYEALALEASGDIEAARTIRERIGFRVSAAGRAQLLPASCEPVLTPRELEVARLVADGGSNRDIAATLNVSVKLVEKHLSSIYGKLALTSRSQLTAHMIARGSDLRRPTA
jgi:DNA-binding CsgD family transcriptional regulator